MQKGFGQSVVLLEDANKDQTGTPGEKHNARCDSEPEDTGRLVKETSGPVGKQPTGEQDEDELEEESRYSHAEARQRPCG